MNQASRTTNSYRNILVGIGGNILSIVFGFIGRTIFVRSLGPEYLGVSSLFSEILGMLSLAELGIGSAIMYALYKPIADKDYNKASLLMELYAKCYRVIGTIVFAIGILLLPFLGYIVKDTPSIAESIHAIYIVFLLNSTITYFFSYKFTLLAADQRNYIVVGWSYVASYITTAVQIIIITTSRNYYAYLTAQLVSTVVYNLIVSKSADKLYPDILRAHKTQEKLPKEEIKELAKNVRALVVIRISALLVTGTDSIIISLLRNLAELGLTSNYNVLSSVIRGFLTQIIQALNGSVGNLNATSTNEEKLAMFKNLNFACFFMYTICAVSFSVLADDVVRVIFGESFIMNRAVTYAISINMYVYGMQQITWIYKSTMGLFDYGKYVLFATAALNIALSWVMGTAYGVAGVLVATSIARLLTNAWYEPYAVFRYGMNKKPTIYYLMYLKQVIIAAAAALISLYVTNFIQGNDYLVISVKAMASIMIVVVIVVVTHWKSVELRFVGAKITHFLIRERGKRGA